MASEILIDGRPATTEDLACQALVNYSAYTSFRVEHGAARGLDLHLARLEQAAVELFGESPGEAELRRLMAQAVAGRDACWLRVSLFSPEIGHRNPSFVGRPRVMTVVSPPPSPLGSGLKVTVIPYVREAAHLKHTATLGLIRARRAARAAGFDDALFADDHGRLSEGSLWNIGFIQAGGVVWPEAPMLRGVTQALIARGLDRAGVRQTIRPVHRDDLAGFDGAFLCNSATPAGAIAAIDAHRFQTDPAMLEAIQQAWSEAPPQTIGAPADDDDVTRLGR